MNNLVIGEYLVWNNVTASFCRNNLVCPASDQVFISKSGFQKASPLLSIFPPSCFEDEAFCVSTGYSSLWCPFSPVCRRKHEGTILSKPIRIKQYGTCGWQYGLLAVLLFVGWLLLRKFFFLTINLCCGLAFPEASFLSASPISVQLRANRKKLYMWRCFLGNLDCNPELLSHFF